MALPDFKNLEQNKNSIPEWSKYMNDDQFISYSCTYKSKIFLDLFDEYILPCEKTGDIRYYVFDPVKHGAAPDKKYPVLMWLHGASNSLMEKECIMCSGAEQFASPKYQSLMGGAYLIVPLANEQRLPDGTILGAWSEEYSAPVKAVYDKVCAEHSNNIGKKFVMGASSGGYFTWQLLEDYTDFFDAAMPMASGYVPSDVALDRIRDNGIDLIIAHGKYDELASFDEYILPRMEKLTKLKNCICFFPEWVYNGDGGVASVFFGIEMGQHCIINWVQHNLIFDNGIPADNRLPDGVTGWIKSVCDE